MPGGTRALDTDKAAIAQIAETLSVPPPAAHA
jgi:hypothetical protein